MGKIKEVIVLRQGYQDQALDYQINKKLKEGWELRGSMVGHTASDGEESWGVITQMMVKK